MGQDGRDGQENGLGVSDGADEGSTEPERPASGPVIDSLDLVRIYCKLDEAKRLHLLDVARQMLAGQEQS